MLTNYLKIALAVLQRRKFFTFISLFGISFTLTIIIVVAAFLDHVLGAAYPDVNRDRELYVTSISMTSQKSGYGYDGEMSHYFFENYVSKLKSNVKVAMHSAFAPAVTYHNNRKLMISTKYTNGAYWEVFEYEFVEGKPYNEQQVANGEKVIVISENARQTYFGEGQQALGKYIEVDGRSYRVTGVVKNVSEAHKYQYADAFLPYKESRMVDLGSKALNGIFVGTLLVDTKANLSAVQEEYAQLVSRIDPNDVRYDKVSSYAGPYLTTFTRSLVDADSSSSGVAKFITIGILFFILFLLLPTLNLVNLNISRIYERASEIGIRKAFGASSGVLVIQFMVENIIITLIGGVIGIGLSWIIIHLINDGIFLNNLSLSINISVMFYTLLACFIFGFVSGVYPAWRMSRLHVVNALKA